MGKLVNRAKMSVTGTPGTGAITLNAAASGYATFAAAGVSNGDVVSYVIEDGSNWECGQGTYSSTGPTLTRTTVQSSSNSNLAISATSAAVVFVDAVASDYAAIPGSGGSSSTFWRGDGVWATPSGTASVNGYYDVTNYSASTGASDNSTAFQNAINAAYTAGGGVVWIPQGTWKFTAQVVVKQGVTLRGVGYGYWTDPSTGASNIKGTVLDIQWGSGSGATNDATKAAFVLNSGAGVRDLAVTYSTQSASSYAPSEFGPTFKLYEAQTSTASPYHTGVEISRVYIFKGYTGIDMRGSKARTSGSAMFGACKFDDVRMAVLTYGFLIDNVIDWCHINKCIQEPGEIGNSFTQSASLRDYVQQNFTMFYLNGACDGVKITDCAAWALSCGLVLDATTGVVTMSGTDFDGAKNGCFIVSGNCANTTLAIDNAWFTAYDSLALYGSGRSNSSNYVLVTAAGCTVSNISFMNCKLTGPSKGWCYLIGSGQTVSYISLIGCQTNTTTAVGGSDYMVNAAASSVSNITVLGCSKNGLAGIITGTVGGSTVNTGNI